MRAGRRSGPSCRERCRRRPPLSGRNHAGRLEVSGPTKYPKTTRAWNIRPRSPCSIISRSLAGPAWKRMFCTMPCRTPASRAAARSDSASAASMASGLSVKQCLPSAYGAAQRAVVQGVHETVVHDVAAVYQLVHVEHREVGCVVSDALVNPGGVSAVDAEPDGPRRAVHDDAPLPNVGERVEMEPPHAASTQHAHGQSFRYVQCHRPRRLRPSRDSIRRIDADSVSDVPRRAIASYSASAMDRRSAYRTLIGLECRRVGIQPWTRRMRFGCDCPGPLTECAASIRRECAILSHSAPSLSVRWHTQPRNGTPGVPLSEAEHPVTGWYAGEPPRPGHGHVRELEPSAGECLSQAHE